MKDFIEAAGVRIRRSNIKAFGISNEAAPAQPAARALVGAIMDKASGIAFMSSLDSRLAPAPRRYVYVTTFQNDNYKFFEDQVDVDGLIKELDGP